MEFLSLDESFVALEGDRFDGNAYIGQALESGAAGVVYTTGRGDAWRESARTSAAWMLEGDDTLTALGDLARSHRRCPLSPPIICHILLWRILTIQL